MVLQAFNSVNKQEEPQKKHVEDEARQTKPSKNHTDRRRSGKLTITQALGDETSRHRSIASIKRRQEKEKRRLQNNQTEREKVIRDVQSGLEFEILSADKRKLINVKIKGIKSLNA